MGTYSPAQFLPIHITKSVAGYLPRADDHGDPLLGTFDLGCKQVSLLPLMAVSRHWRIGSCSIFYARATDEPSRGPALVGLPSKVLKMQDAIATNNHTRIKLLNIYVLMSGFINPDKSPAEKPLRELLLTTGPLTRVQRINIIAMYDSKMSREPLTEMQAELLFRNLGAYVDVFQRLFPNVKNIGVCRNFVSNSGIMQKQLESAFTSMLQGVIGQNTRCFCSTSFRISARLARSLHEIPLYDLTLWYRGDSNVYNELIQRNAPSLRKLCIRDSALLDIVKLTLTQTGTMVYPQLRQLIIDSCSGLINLDHRQPSTNPFPALRRFVCNGRFPFATPIILSANCAQLTALHLDFDMHLARMLDTWRLLELHTFRNLRSISVGSLGSDFERRVSGNKVFLWAVNASPVICSVSITGVKLKNFEQDVLQNVVFSRTLHELHMPRVFLPIKDSLRLIRGFENLVNATLSFTEETDRFRERCPDDQEIDEYQLFAAKYPSSVRILNMTTRHHYSTQCAAGVFVLVASLLPKIQKVLLACQNTEKIRLASIIFDILQNPPYENNSHLTKETFDFA